MNKNFINYHSWRGPSFFDWYCTWFGYNDSTSTLFFIWHVIRSHEEYDEIMLDLHANFGRFLDYYYGKYYDFNA